MGLFPMSATQVTILVVAAMAFGAVLGLFAALWLCGYALDFKTPRNIEDDFRDDEL